MKPARLGVLTGLALVFIMLVMGLHHIGVAGMVARIEALRGTATMHPLSAGLLFLGGYILFTALSFARQHGAAQNASGHCELIDQNHSELIIHDRISQEPDLIRGCHECS